MDHASPPGDLPVMMREVNNSCCRNDEAAVQKEDSTPRPICAVYEPAHNRFWLTRRRGKSLSNGGFGIVATKHWTDPDYQLLQRIQATFGTGEKYNHTKKPQQQQLKSKPTIDNNNDKPQQQPQAAPSAAPAMVSTSEEASDPTTVDATAGNTDDAAAIDITAKKTTTEEYLWVEEALFLWERGVLQALHATGDREMEMHELYALLNHKSHGLALQLYLAFCHLRQQGFRVLRHSPERRRVLHAMHDKQPSQKKTGRRKRPADDNATPSNDNNFPSMQELKLQLRHASATAVPASPLATEGWSLAWDAYSPDQHFSRSAPGLPLFSVLVTSYAASCLPFYQIQECLHQNAPVPLKIATVSDSGIVILFGVSSDGIPPLTTTTTSPKDTTQVAPTASPAVAAEEETEKT